MRWQGSSASRASPVGGVRVFPYHRLRPIDDITYLWYAALPVTVSHGLVRSESILGGYLMDIVKMLGTWLFGRRASPNAGSVSVVAGVPLADDSPLVRQTA